MERYAEEIQSEAETTDIEKTILTMLVLVNHCELAIESNSINASFI